MEKFQGHSAGVSQQKGGSKVGKVPDWLEKERRRAFKMYTPKEENKRGFKVLITWYRNYFLRISLNLHDLFKAWFLKATN